MSVQGHHWLVSREPIFITQSKHVAELGAHELRFQKVASPAINEYFSWPIFDPVYFKTVPFALFQAITCLIFKHNVFIKLPLIYFRGKICCIHYYYLGVCAAPDDVGASPKNVLALIRERDSPYFARASETGAQAVGTHRDHTCPHFVLHKRSLGRDHIPSSLWLLLRSV